MKEQIISIIQKVIKDNYDIELSNINLETPPKKELWDFAFGCFILSKELKKSPAQIAEDLIILFDKEGLFKDVSSSGPYLNFKLNFSIYTEQYIQLCNQDNLNIWEGKSIVIDYIWANVGKPLHIGHMCTPNQWQVLVNLYKKLWYSVTADSHIGDWGIIFWKLIVAFKLWWSEDKLKDNAVEHLLELYIKATSEAEENTTLDEEFRTAFKKLSEWHIESIELWKLFTEYSIAAMLIQLERLNIEYDYDIWESFYAWLGLPKMWDYPDLKYDTYSIVKELIEKKIASRNDDNSVWVIFPDDSKLSSCILEKRDWTHGYFASDLASIKYRCDNWNPEKIIYCTDVRQKLHFQQAFYIWEQANWIWDTKLIHAYNWFISLKDGAMSTRKWKIIRLEDLLDEAESRAEKIILEKRDDVKWEDLKQLSKIIWIWAIKYGYLKKSRETDVVFDWDEFMSFEWNSGPYIQYAYVRAFNILKKSKFNSIEFKLDFQESEEIELVKWLLNFKNVLLEAADKNMPHVLCAYSYDLTKKFNSFYNNIHILNETDEDLKFLRLSLVKKFSETIKDCFSILWIEMPNKM